MDVLTDYDYDAFDRLEVYRSFGGDGGLDDSTRYVYDVLDRVESQEETHPGFKRDVDFTYVGLTDLVAKEVHDDPASAAATPRDVTKSYGYDPYGLRLSLTNEPKVAGSPGVGKAGTFTYAYDVHGSVSALLDESGNVEASYGYDAYGASDPALSMGDNDPLLQLNAYRYTGKRTDSGSGTIDMGARRFAPDAGRFLQPDVYQGAVSNLGLSTDPLTGNRYGLAGGNPVSFMEVDGHRPVEDGTGAGSRTPTSGSYKGIWNEGRGIAPGYRDAYSGETYGDVLRSVASTPTDVVKGGVREGWETIGMTASAIRSCAMDFDACRENVSGFAGALWEDPSGVALGLLDAAIREFASQVRQGNAGEAAGGMIGLGWLKWLRRAGRGPTPGPVKAPLFSQTTVSPRFGHGPVAGKTIDEVAAALSHGSLSPSELPVKLILRNGQVLAMNNRSVLALARSGIDPSEWVFEDVTGEAFFEELLTNRLQRNRLEGGADTIRITGGS